MDLRWIAGYESGHINIAGISGVAAKTSYGLFLVAGLLAVARREGPVQDREGGLAILAFNVKEVDLLALEECQEWAAAPETLQEDLEMWRVFEEEYMGGENPARLFHGPEEARPQYFAPGTEAAVATLRRESTAAFRYGWDALRKDPGPFYALFDPDDLDDKMVAAIEAVLEQHWSSWDGVMNGLRQLLRGQEGKKGSEWVSVGGVEHHRATLYKLRSRLEVIRQAMGPMLDTGSPEGEPFRAERLRSGQVTVLDITRLGDRARRFLFYRIVHELRDQLERRKAGTSEKGFPGRVVVMVDELNRFAPGHAGRHPTREQLVQIATQGRSIGLTMLGLEQMASRVDEEILANVSTHAVGRCHPAELSGVAYAWLRGWRDRVMALPTGAMLVNHPLWRQPVMLRFPRPLHRLAEEARRINKIARWER